VSDSERLSSPPIVGQPDAHEAIKMLLRLRWWSIQNNPLDRSTSQTLASAVQRSTTLRTLMFSKVQAHVVTVLNVLDLAGTRATHCRKRSTRLARWDTAGGSASSSYYEINVWERLVLPCHAPRPGPGCSQRQHSDGAGPLEEQGKERPSLPHRLSSRACSHRN